MTITRSRCAMGASQAATVGATKPASDYSSQHPVMQHQPTSLRRQIS